MKVLCEISVRHVHVTKQHLEDLFGVGAVLGNVRDLSQPGQFLSDKKVDLVGLKRTIEGVSILGPVRGSSQVEIARTDCFTLGVKDVPVRQSGDIKGSPGIVLRAGNKTINLTEGVIVAKRHVHFDPKTARQNNFFDGQIACVKISGERGGTLRGVVVRVDESFAPAIHIDSDEGNALAAGAEAEVFAKNEGGN